MSIRAMIFDFDGTIADTMENAVGVVNSLAGEFGYRPATPEEIPELRKLTMRQLADRMGLAWHKVPLLAARVRKEMARNMPRIQPFAGIPETLAELRNRGTRLGMLTSNNRENVEAFLAAQPALQFDFISTSSGLFTKQHRLRRLLRRERLELAESCYVGDEVRDIEAARETGMKMIAVAWGFSSPDLLAENHPDVLIRAPSELLSLLD